MIVITYLFLLLVIFIFPTVLVILSFCFYNDPSLSKYDNPRNWGNKKLFKEWMSMPKIPLLSQEEWEELNKECSQIETLVAELNSVPVPRGWYGSWGFTGTSFLNRGASNGDFISIIEGLRWLEEELNEVPYHVAIIKHEKPEQFVELLSKVESFINFIHDKGYWDIELQYTPMGRLRRWKREMKIKTRRAFESLWIKSLPALKEISVFIWIFIILVLFSEVFEYISKQLGYGHFNYPTVGELLLAVVGCMGLRKAYDALNGLIMKSIPPETKITNEKRKNLYMGR